MPRYIIDPFVGVANRFRLKRTIDNAIVEVIDGVPSHYAIPDDEPIFVLTTDKGSEYHFAYGRLHRDNDLPAIITADIHCYFLQDEWRRDSGPSIVSPDGDMECWWDGRRIHRVNGPARYQKLFGREDREYYLHGRRLDHQEVCDWIQENGIVGDNWTDEEAAAYVLRFAGTGLPSI